MFKAIKLLLILGLIFILVTDFFRHTLTRILIEKTTRHATGLKLSIEDLNLDILNSSLDMQGIILFNPPGFKNEVMGKASEIFIKYDLLGSLTGGVRLQQLKAKIDEINIIINEKGISNTASFRRQKLKAKSANNSPSASDVQRKSKANKRKKRPKFLIDRLEFSVERTSYMNCNADIGQTAVIVFERKGPYVFNNVSGLEDVLKPVLAKGVIRNFLNNLSIVIPMNAVTDSLN